MKPIPEADWKYMRSIQKELQDRLCGNLLDSFQKEMAENKSGRSTYDVYRAIYRLVHESDRIIGDCFDDWRRSNLFEKLLFLLKHKVISENELQRLTPETRERMEPFFTARFIP